MSIQWNVIVPFQRNFYRTFSRAFKQLTKTFTVFNWYIISMGRRNEGKVKKKKKIENGLEEMTEREREKRIEQSFQCWSFDLLKSFDWPPFHVKRTIPISPFGYVYRVWINHFSFWWKLNSITLFFSTWNPMSMPTIKLHLVVLCVSSSLDWIGRKSPSQKSFPSVFLYMVHLKMIFVWFQTIQDFQSWNKLKSIWNRSLSMRYKLKIAINYE